jgi:hypothetical protein
MSEKEPIFTMPEKPKVHEDVPKQKDENSDIQLPETMLRHKDLSKEDEKKIREQWILLRNLSLIELPNDIRLRQQAGLSELAQGTLVHGTTFDLQKLAEIQRNGVISGEILGIPEDCETNYCADFFRVPENMSVKDYVSWSHEMEPPAEGSKLKTKRMESRYLAGRNNQVTIIINTQNKEIEHLLDMEAYTHGYNKMKTIITGLPVKRNSEKSKRIAAVLCGVPGNFISGLILPPKVCEDKGNVSKIREIFGKNVLLFDINGNTL